MKKHAVALFVLALAACTSEATTPAPTNPPVDPGTSGSPADPEPGPTQASADACGAVRKSMCQPANEGSVVRGIVKFDPARFAGKDAPVLRVFLHHQLVASESEALQGGHPHAYASFEKIDLAKGEAPFTIDLCEFGTAMWSEENCGFNVVVMLDENGNNDPDAEGASAFAADAGELVKMVPVNVSCHAPSSCLEINADCTDGPSCLTFEPLRTCKCAAESCPSDGKTCK